VQARVFATREHLKVLKSVVSTIVIDVMDDATKR
jgi:hypothetical protein